MIKQVIGAVILGGIFATSVGNAIDTHFDNQDTMLCESARVSHNEEYTKKCQCFYAGANIRCINK